MRRYSLFLVMLLYAAAVSGQGDSPSPERTLTAYKKYYAADAADSIYGLFNKMMKSQVTLNNWKKMFPAAKDMVGDIGEFRLLTKTIGVFVYVAEGKRNSLDMQVALDSAWQIAGVFNRPRSIASIKHTNYKVATGEGELAGELLMPPSKPGHKPAVVLIIAGSGPTDRDGNSAMGLRTEGYKLLARGLQDDGIASLRYDKRFVGESKQFTEKVDSVRFEDYVNDARACIRRLKADTNFSAVFVIGHSEGSLIGMIAAGEEKADGYVSLAGAGVRANAIMRRQLRQSGMDSAGAEKTLAAIKAGNEGYIASWDRYDPAVEIAKLKLPVLIIQGLRDLQVSKEDAEKLAAAAPKAQVMYMDSMNHVLKAAPADRNGNLAIYKDPEIKLYWELVPAIDVFIKQPRKKTGK